MAYPVFKPAATVAAKAETAEIQARPGLRYPDIRTMDYLSDEVDTE
jgi:hypothetical protein